MWIADPADCIGGLLIECLRFKEEQRRSETNINGFTVLYKVRLTETIYRLNRKVKKHESVWQAWSAAFFGDDEALFDLLRIFKSLFRARWVVRRVAQACILGEIGFLTEFAKAVSTVPKPHGNTKAFENAYLIFEFDRPIDPLSKKTDVEILWELWGSGYLDERKGHIETTRPSPKAKSRSGIEAS